MTDRGLLFEAPVDLFFLLMQLVAQLLLGPLLLLLQETKLPQLLAPEKEEEEEGKGEKVQRGYRWTKRKSRRYTEKLHDVKISGFFKGNTLTAGNRQDPLWGTL